MFIRLGLTALCSRATVSSATKTILRPDDRVRERNPTSGGRQAPTNTHVEQPIATRNTMTEHC